jgi:uncharacterized membrane protein YkoI
MTIGKRIYWVIALVAVLALAGAAVTLTAHLTSAGGSTPTFAAQPCDERDDGDDATDTAAEGQDVDNVEQDCGDQNEADDADEADNGDIQAPNGTLDDGKDLLPQAGITLEQAVAAAQGPASAGPVGEIDLERWQGKLVFNVDIGDKDIKVDASDGAVLGVESGD